MIIRILIADDHEIFRQGVKSFLPSARWEICGEARTGREAIAKVEELIPDLVILDISMPDLNGADAASHWDSYVREWTAWNHVRTLAPLASAALLTVALRVS